MKLQIGQLAQCTVFLEVFGSSKNEFAWRGMAQVSIREWHLAYKLIILSLASCVLPGAVLLKNGRQDGLRVNSESRSDR